MPATFPNNLSDEERIQRAQTLTQKLVDHVVSLLASAENNAVVLYTDRLSGQIPRSFAANAFNELQRSMHFYFLVRLSAVWDKQSPDRESLPTLASLVDKPSIREHFAKTAYNYNANMAEPRDLNPSTDPEEVRTRSEYWERERERRALKAKAEVERWLAFAIRMIARADRSCVSVGLRPFRDGYIAHNLDSGVANQGRPIKLRYGDEAKLLRITIRIVDRLHLALNRTGFAWDSAVEQARRNSDELWSRCSFGLSEPSQN